MSAVSWGAGDFCGGLIGRITSVFAAILASQSLGLLLAVGLVAASGEPVPSMAALAWAAAAGVSGLAGLGFFYFALANGTMGVIAPLAALVGAGLPVLLAIAGGEPAAAPRLAGIALALAAVLLISLPLRPDADSERRSRRLDVAELPLVLLSGLGFAGFFLFLNQAVTDDMVWWPQVMVRLSGLGLALVAFLGVLVARRASGSWRDRARKILGADRLRLSGHRLAALVPLFAVAGAGDLGGNTFFLFAAHADAFSVAVVLSSLYPVTTTILAAIFLRERLRGAQLVGVALAALAVALLR